MDDVLEFTSSPRKPVGYEEKGRILRFQTALGENAFIVTTLTGNETLAEGFAFHLTVFSETHHALTAEDLVGLKASIGLVKADNTIRYFNGFINRLKRNGSDRSGEKTYYDIHVTSWLQLLLARRTDCRVFQDMSIPDVIESIFQAIGHDACYRIQTQNPHSKRRFVVQYNESDLAFFHRLCHLAGLTYYFEHDDQEHRLCIVDKADQLPKLESAILHLQPSTAQHEHLHQWHGVEQLVTGRYEQNTYNYKNPRAPLRVSASAPSDTLKTPRTKDLSAYLDTETYHTSQDGGEQIRTRAQQGAAKAQVFFGSGDYRDVKVGHHFQLSGPPDEASSITKIIAASQNDRFTLIDVKYHIDALTSGFSCDIEAIQQGELVYPEATFPKINSLQTALVTGPANEEIHTDEHGRIKVQFHWDRHNQHDEHSSCWLRVMQSFAGPGFGAHFTPRIGQEVVIAFENGNPDRPFVLGALYHPENVPPYAEHNGTRAGLRTHSTKSTDASRYNELYFEDKLGAEEIYVQAERDHTHLVKHNLSTTVGNDKTQKIANNESTAVGKNAQRNIGDTYTVEAGNGIKIKAGNEITLEAGKEISLKVGGSTINLTSGKIEISGAVVLVKGNIALN